MKRPFRLMFTAGAVITPASLGVLGQQPAGAVTTPVITLQELFESYGILPPAPATP